MLNPPTSYVMHFEGQGGAAGHGKGSAEVKLEAIEFFETFNAQLQERYGVTAEPEAAPAAVEAPQGLGARIAAWFKKLFGG